MTDVVPAGGGRGTDDDSVEFLRRSLVDLDGELAAGDLSPADHARLRDEYTARLARALRGQPEAVRATPAAEPRRSPWLRWALAGGLVVVVAVVAGVLVAQASGTRTSVDTLSGGIDGSTATELRRCLELSSQGSALEAIRCYDGVLEGQPDNVEALTYRGWLLVRAGDERLAAEAAASLDRAVALDPTYPDARVFRAVLLLRLGRPAEAGAELEAFDALDPPPAMVDLVEQFQLRQRIAEELAGG